jgi:inorganic pyrophosphatase
MEFIGDQITQGAIAFLNQEYFYLAIFAALFAVILGVTVDLYEMGRPEKEVATNFPYTAISFLVGAATSILAGYIGMRIAVYTNTRTTFECCRGEMLDVTVDGKSVKRKDLKDGFFVAFRGGQVLGFVLVGLALLIL